MKVEQAKGGKGRSVSAKSRNSASPHKAATAARNGSGYRSAKTGRYVSSNAPQVSDPKKRTAIVGRATKRVKTAVAVDLTRARHAR